MMQAAAWHYVDKDGAQAGPVDVKGMAGLFQGGEIDGLTNVWHGELPGGWKPLSEVSEERRDARASTSTTKRIPPITSPAPSLTYLV